ncbi:MAG: ribosome small subunit-dependent GTPase A [Eubacteriales bacterium]
MVEGTVIKAYSGFYYVLAGQEVFECRLRGLFRHIGQNVLVGDRVIVRPLQGSTGLVEKVLPRRSELTRPPVANVNHVVIVFALKDPEPNLPLLERLLIIAGIQNMEPLICFNKADLWQGGQPELIDRYRKAGYRLAVTSVRTGEGLDGFKKYLQGHLSVLAGPSGVGKSTLLNAILPGISLRTGEISAKPRSGKHTTRHVELIPMPGGGLVADTPGFSSLSLPEMKPGELSALYPEMASRGAGCRFSGCLHYKEPDCEVKLAAESGEINGFRYRQYIEFLEELLEKRRY